ncbi:MAG: hypothetical protein WCJ92_07530 [Alphaproteobacteria bacterium]
MPFKITLQGLLIAASFVSTNLVGMDISPIDAQIEIVKLFAATKSGENVSLLLGAVNTRERVEGNWVFLDDESDRAHHTPDGRPYIKGDFNDITLLEILADNLESCFDVILVDDSTFKFAEWNTQCLSCFSRMLKPDGTFVFCLGADQGTVLFAGNSHQYQPYLDEIKGSATRLKTEEATEGDFLQSNGLKLFTGTFDQYYQEGLLPYNQALLSKVFSSVELRKNRGFPIPSRWTHPDTEIDLFVCKKASAAASSALPAVSILHADRTVSTSLILDKLAHINFSEQHGTCADVFNRLEQAIAKTIFDGSTQSWVYKGNILGAVAYTGPDMLDDYTPLLNVAFQTIIEKVQGTENGQEIADSLYNLRNAYKCIRLWMEGIWNNRDTRALMRRDVPAMGSLYLQTDLLKSVLASAPRRVENAYNSQVEKFHPCFARKTEW